MYESPTDFNPGLFAAAKDKSNDMNDKFRQKVLAAGPGNNSKGMPFLGIGKKKRGEAGFEQDPQEARYEAQSRRMTRQKNRKAKRAARKEKRNAAAEMHCMGKKK